MFKGRLEKFKCVRENSNVVVARENSNVVFAGENSNVVFA